MTDYETIKSCRSCGAGYFRELLDFGIQPLANALVKSEEKDEPQQLFPLTLVLCPDCLLVQIKETVSPAKLFGHYVYFSSQSQTMVKSAQELVQQLVQQEKLGPESFAMEVASNDGYLLQHYRHLGIPYLGIDPAENVAAEANIRGITTRIDFFDERVAEEYAGKADVLHANNVLAHVADTRGFVRAIAKSLKPEGLAVIEFPYIGSLIERVEFDTVYHEHLCYFSLMSVDRLLSNAGLKIERIERLSIHGGSLRVFARLNKMDAYWPSETFNELWLEERAKGMEIWSYYNKLAPRTAAMMEKFWQKLHELGEVAACGAAAKGSTLLNYPAPGRDPGLIKFICDSTPAKQGLLSPGGLVPIVPPPELQARMPKNCLILAWNFAQEIAAKERGYADRGGKFWIPDLEEGLVEFKEQR